MSALSFKINAEIDKLNSFIASLERLKTVLGDIPSGTKEFDVINRKIAEMEARVEQSMKKIAQIQGEAFRAVEQAASAGNTASGSQATKEDNVAYHELLETLKAVNASKEENIALISRYQAQIVKLKTDIKDLNEAERRGKQLTNDQKSSRFAAAVSIEEYKQAISRARKELANQIKLEQVARGSIDEMSQALSRMRAVYRSLNESERGSGWGQTLLKNIETLDAKIKGLDASMGVHARNVGNYASGFDMLGFQIQQVARELPSLAYGPQVFFAAISNNLPMLADEIARAKKQVKELKNAGESFTPVWKQIASSLISWQTLLVAGVTVLTLYGKEIVGWTASLFKGKQALDSAKVAADQFHATMTEGTVAAQAELTKLDLIYKAATDLSKPYKERAEAVNKLQDIYPAYFGNMAAEQIMVGNAVGVYESLRDAIIEVARAKAAQDLITKDAQSIQRIEQTGDAYNNYANALKKYDDEYKRRLEQNKDSGFELPSAIFEAEQYAKSVSGIKKYRKEFISALEKMGDEGKEIWKQIKDNYNGDVDAFVDAINEGIEKLAPAAEKLYTGKTPQELNAAANKARQEAENAARKATAQQERDQKELEKALKKLRDEALQSEIDSMQDGAAKKIAQINLDYKKREQVIKEGEENLKKLQGGNLPSDQQNMFVAMRAENTLARMNSIAQIEIDEIDAEEKAMDAFLAKYGNYQEKRLVIMKEYAAKIAKAKTEGEKLLYSKEEADELKKLDFSMVEKSTLWTRLFKDAKTMATSSIASIIHDTELLIEYIDQIKTGHADDSIIAALGLTKEQVESLMADPRKIESILDALRRKRDELNKQDPFGALIRGFKDLKKAANDADKQMGAINEIIDGAQGAANIIRDVGDSVSELGEAIGSDFVSGFGNALTEISNVANSAISGAMSGMAIGGPIGAAIGAGVGILSGVIGGIGKRLKYNKQVREEYQNTLRKEYLAEYEINALYRERYDWAKKIGETTLSYLNRNTQEVRNQYAANQQEQEELWAKLMGSEYVSSERYRHGTWFRKAKVIKGYSTLQGKSWDEIELLATQGKLTNEAKDYYEALKKAREEGEELEKQMEQIAEETREAFTGIGFDTLVDGIVNGFKEGKRTMSDFADDFEDMMRDAVLQSLKMTALEEPLRKWYEDFADKTNDEDGLTKQEIADLKADYARIIESAGKQADELERITGIPIGSTSSQTATSRGFQAMSQDTGDELNGRFTDIQGKVTDIRGFMMSDTMQIIGILHACQHIEVIQIEGLQVNQELLRHAVMTYLEIVEINSTTKAMNKTLLSIDKRLYNIERNTSEL